MSGYYQSTIGESPCLNRCPRLVGICCLLGKVACRVFPMDAPNFENTAALASSLWTTGLALCQRCGRCLVLAFIGGFAKSGQEMRRRSGRDWPEQQLNQRDQDSRQTLPLHLLQEFGQGASQNLQRASLRIPVHRISEESGQPAQRQAGPVPSKLSSCGCKAEPAELGLLGSTGSLLFGCLVAMTLFAVPAWR